MKRRLSLVCCLAILHGASAPAFAQVARLGIGRAAPFTGPAGMLPAAAPAQDPAILGGVSSLQGALVPILSAPGLLPAPAPALSVPNALVPVALAAAARLPAAAADLPRLPAVLGAVRLSAAVDGEKPAAPGVLGAAKEPAAESLQSADAARMFDGAAELVPFRLKIREQGVYLLETGSTKDDSVGRRLTTSLQAADIGAALKAHAPATLRGRTIYVTGVEMGSEQDALKRVREAVSETAGGLDNVKIQILSIPRPRSKGFLRSLRDRAIYFLPSRRRDFQAPLRDEVISGAASTLILELPNAVYLFSALPSPDAAIVLTVHGAVLGAYAIWQRSLGNWLLRAKGGEMFAKQLLMALPFVVNYNVLGHYSELASFQRTHGVSGMLEQFPAQLLRFSVTQGLTIVLQTLFYAWVVTRGFRAWASSQKSPQDAEAARSWINWLMMPWLWIDAIFLTQAATAATVLFKWNSFSLTGGHLSLAALTALGSIVVFYPALLDKTLPVYKRIRAVLGRLRGKTR